MREHTPTPWRIDKDGSIWSDRPELRYVGNIGPVCGGRVCGTAADRAFVRAACNFQGALIEALSGFPRQLRGLAAELGPCLQAKNLREIADSIENTLADGAGKKATQ